MLANGSLKRSYAISSIALIIWWSLAHGATYVVSQDYEDRFIQATINRASDGDRVIVKSGQYRENLNITKKVSIIGLDTGGGMPIVDGGYQGSAVVISADDVLFEGFRVVKSGKQWKDAGIKVISKNAVIRNNNVTGNAYGIVLDGSTSNIVLKNNVSENDVGISLYSSDGCTIVENDAFNNTFSGILLSKANNNTIRNNNASLNHWAGIILGESSNNSITNNIARYNENEGIWLLRSNFNTVTGNRIRYNYIFGIRLLYSNRNSVSSNTVRDNLDGISIESSNGNILAGNKLSINEYGVYVDNSFNNRIYMNNLINNVKNAHSWNSTNFWNSTEIVSYSYRGISYKRHVGNHWSGYFGPDPFGDGLGDTPHIVMGAEWDHSPLMKPSEGYALQS